MSSVTALVIGAETRALLRGSLRESAPLAFCERRDELLARVAMQPTGVVITELWDVDDAPTAPTVRELRRAFPAVTVLAYCTLTERTSRELLAMAHAGVNGLVLRGIDDLGGALRLALSRAEADCLDAIVLHEMEGVLSIRARQVVSHCLLRAAAGISVGEVAAALGASRRTLVNQLAHDGMPAPSLLIGWCRLLVAARLLETSSRSVESIALALGFGSGAALRNMLRRYTGLRPRDVRRLGGPACVLQALRGKLQSRPAAPRTAPTATVLAVPPTIAAPRRHSGPSARIGTV